MKVHNGELRALLDEGYNHAVVDGKCLFITFTVGNLVYVEEDAVTRRMIPLKMDDITEVSKIGGKL